MMHTESSSLLSFNTSLASVIDLYFFFCSPKEEKVKTREWCSVFLYPHSPCLDEKKLFRIIKF